MQTFMPLCRPIMRFAVLGVAAVAGVRVIEDVDPAGFLTVRTELAVVTGTIAAPFISVPVAPFATKVYGNSVPFKVRINLPASFGVAVNDT